MFGSFYTAEPSLDCMQAAVKLVKLVTRFQINQTNQRTSSNRHVMKYSALQKSLGILPKQKTHTCNSNSLTFTSSGQYVRLHAFRIPFPRDTVRRSSCVFSLSLIHTHTIRRWLSAIC